MMSCGLGDTIDSISAGDLEARRHSTQCNQKWQTKPEFCDRSPLLDY